MAFLIKLTIENRQRYHQVHAIHTGGDNWKPMPLQEM